MKHKKQICKHLGGARLGSPELLKAKQAYITKLCGFEVLKVLTILLSVLVFGEYEVKSLCDFHNVVDNLIQ